MVGVGTADASPSKQVGLVRTGIYAAGSVEYLADVDAAIQQMIAGRLNVGDDQVQAARGARCCLGDVRAEDNRAPGARGRELDHAVVLAAVEVCVEAPPESAVELLRAVDIRNGDD